MGKGLVQSIARLLLAYVVLSNNYNRCQKFRHQPTRPFLHKAVAIKNTICCWVAYKSKSNGEFYVRLLLSHLIKSIPMYHLFLREWSAWRRKLHHECIGAKHQ